MAIEKKRGCGYRKAGGLYLVGSASGVGCHRLPINLDVCSCCGAGIKYSRGYTGIDAAKLFGKCENCHCNPFCFVCNPPEGKHGLLWIGKKFYTPQSFISESNEMGISKRISALPRDFKLGETVIYLAHLEAGLREKKDKNAEVNPSMQPKMEKCPAIFLVFKPKAVEKILTEKDATEEEVKKLANRGINVVVVPNDDKDHAGTVYDVD